MTKDAYEALIDYVEQTLSSDAYNHSGYYDVWGLVHIANDRLVAGWPEEPDIEHTYLAGSYLEHGAYHGNHSAKTLMQWVVDTNERLYEEGAPDEDDFHNGPLGEAVKEVCALAASSPYSPFK